MRMTRLRITAVVAISTLVAALVPSSGFGAPAATTMRRQTAPMTRTKPARITPLVVPLSADDDIPGVPLPPGSSATGTVNAATDTDDVFQVTLGEGEILVATITGPAGTYFDLWLFDRDAMSVNDDFSIAYSDADDRGFRYPFTLQFKADPSLGYGAGTYYLDVWAAAGSGQYTITWHIIPDDLNDDIPGLPLPSSPVDGWASSAWVVSKDETDFKPVDGCDVYGVELREGERLTATVARTSGSRLGAELFLYPSTASHVDTDGDITMDDAWIAMTNTASDVMPETLEFVVPPGGAGTYYLDVEAWFNHGGYRLTYTIDAPSAFRLAGANRYATGQAIARSTTTSSSVAVLASGLGFADALSASGLAGALSAPLLLVHRDYVPTEAIAHLIAMGITDLYVVGGPGAVSTSVEEELTSYGFAVERVWGDDRYETSHACAEKVWSLVGPVPGVFVVRGDAFADALAVSPAAFTQRMPVLLTKPSVLVPGAASFIEDHDVTNVCIAGGTGAISDAVENEIKALNGGPSYMSVVRKAGINRYETAKEFAAYAVERGWASWAFVGVATGTNFPDALAGGIGCGAMGGVLLLTHPTTLSPETRAILDERRGDLDRIAVFGGPGAVSDGVFDQLRTFVER